MRQYLLWKEYSKMMLLAFWLLCFFIAPLSKLVPSHLFLSIYKWVDRLDSRELESFICQYCVVEKVALPEEVFGFALSSWKIIFVIHDWSVFVQGGGLATLGLKAWD